MTTIIAECGINFSPDKKLALEMIAEAKRCGADIAKFQLYKPEELLNPDDFIAQYGRESWECVKAAELLLSDCWELRRKAAEVDIELMFSVFHERYIPGCESLGVKRYKIASNQVHNRELIKAVKDTGKPLIISCPNGKLPETWDTEDKLLFCVPMYPATPAMYEGVDYGCFDGISDHTIGIGTSIEAIKNGAQIVEKHFTLDRKMPGPDQVVSIEPLQLEALVTYGREAVNSQEVNGED